MVVNHCFIFELEFSSQLELVLKVGRVHSWVGFYKKEKGFHGFLRLSFANNIYIIKFKFKIQNDGDSLI
jgi:hypothetical protein